MATIRRRGDKWHVQVRRTGQPSVTRSFMTKADAQTWARQVEVKADRQGLPPDLKTLTKITVGEVLTRYRNEVVPGKRGKTNETILIDAFLKHRLAKAKLSELTVAQVASYRDERLVKVKPSSLYRELAVIRHAFNVARKEWEIPLPINPFAEVTIPEAGSARTRRLKPGEWEKLERACKGCRNPWIVFLITMAVSRRG